MTEKQFAAEVLKSALGKLVDEAKVCLLTSDTVASGLGKKRVGDTTVDKVHTQLKKLVGPVVRKCDNLLKPKVKKVKNETVSVDTEGSK